MYMCFCAKVSTVSKGIYADIFMNDRLLGARYVAQQAITNPGYAAEKLPLL